MISVHFYKDSRPDKNLHYPIYLQVRSKKASVKLSTKEKVKLDEWDPVKQEVTGKTKTCQRINSYLRHLKSQVEKTFLKSGKNINAKDLKEKLGDLIELEKSKVESYILQESDEYAKKDRVTFIDLFAGAGGFSEGFLQADSNNKIFDFLLASDINENCELTHEARYNYQLGLEAAFIKQDITEPSFLENLLLKIGNKTVDVVCGGPPCQSFSLAGKRKKFDKKDDLFSHYLKVIRQLRPKYFVMENVKGILTKEGGLIRELILKEIRSIIDQEAYPELIEFIAKEKGQLDEDPFLLDCYLMRLQFEFETDPRLGQLKANYIDRIEQKFRKLTPKIVDYKTSKTDESILSIRHGLNLLKRTKELEIIRKKIIYEKSYSDVDGDLFVNDFDAFLSTISPEGVIEKIKFAIAKINPPSKFRSEISSLIKALSIYNNTFDDCVGELGKMFKEVRKGDEFSDIIEKLRLYNIDKPIVALASDYGVPQNRERVLFIGCRKDQKLISSIPPTVLPNERVTVFEALHDLDFINNNDEASDYEEVDLKAKFNGKTEEMISLIKRRDLGGKVMTTMGRTYAEWSKIGRLNGRFNDMRPPVYFRNKEEFESPVSNHAQPLHNHKTSNQNSDVIRRLEIILTTGDYSTAKKKLSKVGLDSEKRNYNVLKPAGQSPTVMTIADDYIHYNAPRALTVREMARLQSFDDSFVFQGKRSTGGNKRKSEIPQFTLVGNAVPPLMARAIGLEILKSIH